MRRRFSFLLWIGLLLIATVNQAWTQGEKARKEGSVSDYRTILKFLDLELELQDFEHPMNLRDAFENFRRQLAAKGHELPIFVDVEAFKEENPDAPNVYDTQIWFTSLPKRMLLRSFLRQVLARVTPPNATYIVRDGTLEITTYDRAATTRLIQQRITCEVNDRPLADALQELAERSGVSIVVDPRTGDRAKIPVSARFRGDLSVEAAIHLLVDMAELKAVVLPAGVYLTTAENAEHLRKESTTWQVPADGSRRKKKKAGPAR